LINAEAGKAAATERAQLLATAREIFKRRNPARSSSPSGRSNRRVPSRLDDRRGVTTRPAPNPTLALDQRFAIPPPLGATASLARITERTALQRSVRRSAPRRPVDTCQYAAAELRSPKRAGAVVEPPGPRQPIWARKLAGSNVPRLDPARRFVGAAAAAGGASSRRAQITFVSTRISRLPRSGRASNTSSAGPQVPFQPPGSAGRPGARWRELVSRWRPSSPAFENARRVHQVASPRSPDPFPSRSGAVQSSVASAAPTSPPLR